ncbi:MAG: hypothetical protein HDKAJFGB_02000 [Anaerolineae bacterium]|nr:hypothetical protein [Anaerolineae bacterium]
MFKNQIHDMDAWVEERLSDYLDGTLSPQDRAKLEAHLQTSERERASLESLRWTVNLLKQTPAPTLPRQFTLPVTQHAPSRSAPSWMVWGLRGIAVAATAAFVLLLVGTLIRQPSSGDIAMTSGAAPAAAPSVMIALAPTATAPVEPAAAESASSAAADTGLAATPIMITVEPPATAAAIVAPTQAAPPAAKTQPSPQPTRVTRPTQAPPPAQNANPSPTVITPKVAEMQPTNASASASSAAGSAPEFATPEATDTTAQQRSFGTPTIEGVVLAERLRVRAGPGSHYPTLGILQRNDRVTLVGTSAPPGWFAIQYLRADTLIEGWVAARLIGTTDALDSLPVITPPVNETPESAPPTLQAPETVEPTVPAENETPLADVTPMPDETPVTPTATPEG